MYIHAAVIIKEEIMIQEGEVGHSRSWGGKGSSNIAVELMYGVLKMIFFKKCKHFKKCWK